MRKLLFIIVLLGSSAVLFGQFNQGITVPNNPFYQLPIQQTPTVDFRVAFSSQTPFHFSKYNQATGLNDNYMSYQGNFSFSKSIAIANNPHRGAPIDSFNPYGSTHFGSAILQGVLNSIF